MLYPTQRVIATSSVRTWRLRTQALVVTLRRKTWRTAAPGIEATSGDRDGKREQGGGHGEVGRRRAPAAGGRAQVRRKYYWLDEYRTRTKTTTFDLVQNTLDVEAGFLSATAPCCSHTKYNHFLVPFPVPSRPLSMHRVPRASKKRLATAKELMFRDSQKLYALRQEEANLIAEICGAQASIVDELKAEKRTDDFPPLITAVVGCSRRTLVAAG